MAPEAIKFIQRQQNNLLGPDEKINPYKADIYSCGILGLILLGVILTPENLEVFDNLKNNEKDHQTIIDMANQIKFEDNQIMQEKMKFIIQLCIDYDPVKRPNFIQLSGML